MGRKGWSEGFARRLVAWQRVAGRHGLPWQGTRDPYRVWLSEVMLQQTQVATVVRYYERFLARFPTVEALAAASEEEVLALWSGLGYYSRARLLHRCAQQVAVQWGARFPTTAEALQRLPGIGPSTAAAIASFCFGQRVSIFDGNVQRVLARVSGFAGDLAVARARHQLWALAQLGLPSPEEAHLMPAYTQALMDLGATVCTPRSPACDHCPLKADCVALKTEQVARLPVRSRTLKRKTLRWWWLVLRDDADRVALVRRPRAGIWAGLYVFPTFDSEAQALAALPVAWQTGVVRQEAWLHVLTHADLWLHPLLLRVAPVPDDLPGCEPLHWVAHPQDTEALGLPAAVRRWLEEAAARGQQAR